MTQKPELDNVMSYILHHDKEDWEYYTFYIWDRVKKEIVHLPTPNIMRVYDGHFIIINEDKTVSVVPMHRIRKIYKRKELVFERSPETTKGK